MNTKILSAGVLAAASMFAASAGATTYYVADCQAGADASCVAGKDTNAGTSASAPWQTPAKVQSVLANLAAGDQVLFARGGSWTNVALNPSNFNATPSSPIVFDAYKPSWGGGTARPILTQASSTNNVFTFSDFGAGRMDGGYTVRNLDLRGANTGQWGMFFYGGVTNVTIDNVSITGFQIGIHINSDSVSSTNFSITNSTVASNRQHGILGSASNVVIQNNTFTGNGNDAATYGQGMTHGVYLGSTRPQSNVQIRNNTFTDNTMYNGSCVAGPLVVHGQWDNVLIEGNMLTQSAAAPGCYGISIKPDYSIAEYMTHFVVRGNTVVNMGQAGIALTSVPGIIVEDNTIINTQATSQVAIALPVKQRDSNDAADGGAIIRNNSIYFATYNANNTAIQANAEGTGHQVVSNLIYFGGSGSGSTSCFRTGATTSFAAFGNNLCYTGGGASLLQGLLAAVGSGLTGTITGNPLLVALPSASNGWSMAIQSTSPARDAGALSLSSLIDKTLGSRDSRPDIGAYEYRGTADTVAPGVPTNVQLQ